MNKKTNSNIINNIIPWIALIVSLLSAYFSWKANNISNEANVISREANIIAQNANSSSERNLQIEENRKLNENKEKSVKLIDNLYDKIMYTPELYDIYNKISKNSLVWNEEYLQRFIDEFEGVWSKYCQEQIYRTDLKTYTQFLQQVCTNLIIEKIYWWYKNWLSKICVDVVWEKWMWWHFNWKNDCRVLE